MSVSPSNTQPVTATVGYKSFDLSVVPVTTKSTAGTPSSIRGCFSSSNSNNACQTDPENPAPAPVSGSQLPSTTATETAAGTPIPVMWPGIRPAFSILSPPVLQEAARGRPPPSPEARMSLQGSAVTVGSARDALSVYSSFNGSGGGAGGGGPSPPQTSSNNPLSVSLSLGKVFATGVAAQFLSYGQFYYLQAAGAAQCVEQLAKAAGTTVKETTITQVCGTPQQR